MPTRKPAAPPVKTPEPIHVLLAEDHVVVRDGLAAIINQEPDMIVVAVAGEGGEAVKLWKRHRPDITLMDLRMPGLSGANAIYEIHEINPDVRIIVLTTFDGDEDIYRAVRAGAKAYLLKDVQREELFHCIREVHAGRIVIPPAVAAKLAGRQNFEELTTREMDVLRLLAEGKPNKLIAADLNIGEVTVKSHVRAIFNKLNVLSRTEAIASASRLGLLRA
ncbi:MAG: response regulator transcription factor [Verrucomicrobiota bacterium]